MPRISQSCNKSWLGCWRDHYKSWRGIEGKGTTMTTEDDELVELEATGMPPHCVAEGCKKHISTMLVIMKSSSQKEWHQYHQQ